VSGIGGTILLVEVQKPRLVRVAEDRSRQKTAPAGSPAAFLRRQ